MLFILGTNSANFHENTWHLLVQGDSERNKQKLRMLNVFTKLLM